MNPANYPRADDADICLVLEGTYPFVGGGVSNWVYELIRAFPNYRFAIIFLGTQASDYTELVYPLADNVVHLEAHFLFEQSTSFQDTLQDIDSVSMQTIQQTHNNFVDFPSATGCPMGDVFELFKLLDTDGLINEGLFLRSRNAWQMIRDQYSAHHAELSFFDYFWGVRNLHRPFWPLAKIIKHIPKVKVLHSASTGYAGLLGALLQKKYNLPYLITEHGLYTKERWIDLMRHYFFEQIITKHQLFEQEKGLLSIWIRFFSILANVGYSAANPIISLFEAHQMQQIKDGADPLRTKIISYGIDFNHYTFIGKSKPNQAKPIIACIGRVVPIKDIKTFIRASALVIKQIPTTEAWIVGSLTDDVDYVAQCVSLIKMLGLEDKIKFLGKQIIMDIYPQIDLLMLSSISEGSPFVMLESLAVGIPIVATDVGGCKELIYGKNPEDKALGAAGKLVNIANPQALANAALELLTDESSWVLAQSSGMKRVRQYYSMQELVEHYGLIYQLAME